jgi:hypothetical protein
VNFTIEEDYKNSMANGTGAMLWNINVNYNGLNASDLLAQDGLYLVYKITYSEDIENASTWYAFANSFFEESENYNSTGYMNKYVYSIQFAVVDVEPDDTTFGSYENVALTDSNFIAVSNIYYNLYY